MPQYVGWPVVAIGLSFALPDGLPRGVGHALIDGTAAVVAVAALGRRRPPPALPWWVLCLSLGSNVVNDVTAVLARAGVAPHVMSTLSQGADLATAVLVATTAVLFLVACSSGPRRAGLLDGGIVVSTAVMLVLASPLADELQDAPLLATGTVAAIVAAVVFFGIVAFHPSRRSPSLFLLSLATGVALAATLVRLAAGGASPWSAFTNAAYLLAQVLAACAIVHPSMTWLDASPARTGARVDPLRLVVLGAALLVNPAVVLVHVVGGEGSRLPLALGVALLSAVVLVRIVGLLQERDQARTGGIADQRFRALVQHAFDVIAVVDRVGRIGYISPSAGHVLGRSPTSCIGRHLRQLVARDDAPLIDGALAALEPARVARVEVRLDGDGVVRWGDVLLADLLADPNVRGIVVNLRDVTERKRAELELSRLALHDPLTGLPNRVRLLDRVAAVLAAEGPRREFAALFFCDLDGFKAVNDRYGHDVGDHLLRAVAERFREALRDGDEATRLGGDEFVVLCCEIASQAQALAIGARLRSRVFEPFALHGLEVRVGCSVGIALADRPGLTPEAVLQAADLAMYRAKRLHGGVALHRWPDGPRTRPAERAAIERAG